jgi:hypothetical protein
MSALASLVRACERLPDAPPQWRSLSPLAEGRRSISRFCEWVFVRLPLSIGLCPSRGRMGLRIFSPKAHRVRGEILLKRDPADPEPAKR